MRALSFISVVTVACLSAHHSSSAHSNDTSASSLTGASEINDKEYQVKAALLLNIAKFTTYPSGVGSGSFTIGIVGEDPFGQVIEATLNGKDKDGASFVIKRLGNTGSVAADALKACQIVFIPATETPQCEAIRGKLGGAPVLLIGETEDAIAKGSMASLPIVGGKPKIMVHAARITEHKLEMASKLLQAAEVVK